MDVMRFRAAALACGVAVIAAGSEHGAVAAVLMHLHAAAAVHVWGVLQTLFG
jgi:acyl-CoA reductase-like NAD-dependent aldehyde dehydrogenase